jgi:hypothetical protein
MIWYDNIMLVSRLTMLSSVLMRSDYLVNDRFTCMCFLFITPIDFCDYLLKYFSKLTGFLKIVEFYIQLIGNSKNGIYINSEVLAEMNCNSLGK